MYKLKILIITVIAIGGALIIYNHFEKTPERSKDINEFSKAYTNISEDNIYKISTIDEIIHVLSNETGVIFFCTPESAWCQKYAFYLNNGLKELNVEKIYYLNIKDYRELNTVKYQKIVDLLSDYLYSDDVNNKKIYMPDLTFVKNGNVIAHNNQTALVQSDNDPESYWSDNRIKDFNNKLKEYVELMNKEEELLEEGLD